MFLSLLKLTFVVSSLSFGVILVAQTKDDDDEQKAMDGKVVKISGVVALLSGLALWLIGW